MELVISIVVFLFLLIILFPNYRFKNKNRFKNFSKNQSKFSRVEKIENKNLKKLIILGKKASSFFIFTILPHNEHRVKKDLLLSGLEKNIFYEDIMAVKRACLIICFCMFIVFFIIQPSTTMFLLTCLIGVMGYYIPDNMLHGKASKRQWIIEKELPSTLTNLAIITDAGLNLFQAIETLAENNTGELSKELKRTVDDIKLGISQKEAFEKFAERCSIEEVHYFISAILQGLKKGSSGLTEIIRQQADESWDKRKKKAKELAGKASIKLFLPLLLMVFPAFIIFLMGPMMFSLMEFFR